MCGNSCNGCLCGSASEIDQEFDLAEELQRVYDQGYNDAFRDARHLFWAELRIKSGDAKMVANELKKNGSEVDSDSFHVAAATYFNAAEAILRGRRDYPGYMEDGKDPSNNWRPGESSNVENCDDDSCNCG